MCGSRVFAQSPPRSPTIPPLLLEDGHEVQLTLLGPIKTGYSARLSGVKTKEQADGLKGQKLFARREQLPALPDDEFYYTDLEGLEVVDTGGAVLGTVKSVQNHGAGDLLEVQGPALKNTVLVPFTKEVVPTVDLSAGRVVTDPPEGLF